MKPWRTFLTWGIILAVATSEAPGQRMSPFRLLQGPYLPCTFVEDTKSRPEVWLDVFSKDTATFERRAAVLDQSAALRFGASWKRVIHELRLQGEAVNVLTLPLARRVPPGRRVCGHIWCRES